MSICYDLLQEQVNLLKEKGYEEKAIGSPDKRGWLFTQLRQSFADVLHQSWQESDAVTFQIATTGFFNDDKDFVHFKFCYEFNSENNSLLMKEIELTAEKIGRKITIYSPQDVPHSTQALTLIREQIRIERKRASWYIPVHASKQNRRAR